MFVVMGSRRSPGDGVVSVDAEIAKQPTAEGRKFGRHVRTLRRARGMTQDWLAERSGLSPDTIRRLEHGAFSPSLETLTKLCTGLLLALSTLFESFELGERNQMRELFDLLSTRTPREIKLATNLLRALFDELDEIEVTTDDADGEEPAKRGVPDGIVHDP
jgi:transcriptional regulator with XRE-family HTH domain